MKTLRFTLLSSLMLALLGPCFGTGVAKAQGITGKFTLPFAAHWGLATLEPGDYSFKLTSAPTGVLCISREAKTVAMIYPQTFDQKTSGPAVLRVEQDNDTNTIREMALPSAGLVLYYAPQHPKHGTAQEERRAARVIPIAVMAGGQ